MAEKASTVETGAALVIFYSDDLATTQAKVTEAGGEVRPVFSFPGGSRFHFFDPTGNEFAVWKKSEE